jgi:hypothetical protein
MFRRIPITDRAAPYPEVAAHRAALNARDWPAARAVYDAATSWELRQELVYDAGDQEGVEEFLTQVLARDPQDTVAATMLGTRLVVAGWKVRSRRSARYVSAKRFEVFHDHLRRAETVLGEVCARDPGAVPAWTERLVVARGLGLGLAEARRRYTELSRHAPHHLPGQAQLLQQLCPKWGGSFDAMHAFARQCTQAAPPGAHQAKLIVVAHLEHYSGVDSPLDYFRRGEVRDEIRAAGERSVLHPDFQQTPGWVSTLSTFALGFTLTGQWTSAKHCFDRLGRFAGLGDWWPVALFERRAFRKWRRVAKRRG